MTSVLAFTVGQFGLTHETGSSGFPVLVRSFNWVRSVVKGASESQFDAHEVAHFYHLLRSERATTVGDDACRQGVSAEDFGGQQFGDLLCRGGAAG